MYTVAAIGLLFLLGVAVLLVVASRKPNQFSVRREVEMAASPGAIFPLINDFRAWAGWSPWEKLDPNMQRTFSGSPSGIGAGYAWEGNKKVGRGSMTITQSDVNAQVVIDLHFITPIEARNVTTFLLEGTPNGTRVSWVMTGQMPFAMKVMDTFMAMDKLIGKDFESGLAAMKTLAEKTGASQTSAA